MQKKLNELIQVCQWMNQSGFSPATSGNYSIRIDDASCYVSASGVDKGNLKVDDFIVFGLNGEFDQSSKKPSDESGIHAKIYELDSSAECVLHAHSLSATIIGQVLAGDHQILFHGLELQKAFVGIETHEAECVLPIIENNQNIPDLCRHIKLSNIPAFLIRGHGVYCWGRNIKEAKKHLEALEFLLKCQLEILRLKK